MEGARPAGNRVLIIGNGEQHQRVALALESAGLQVLQAAATLDGLVRAMEDAPQLVVLIAARPPVASTGLLSTLRDLVSVPIIMVGPEGDVPLLQALFRGADLYLTPRTSCGEFLAYARALLRRHAPVDGARMDVTTPARNRVLIIGQSEQHQSIALALESAGLQVLQVAANREQLVSAMEDAPHLVVLNAGTPPEASMGLLSTLRDLVGVPIIIVGPDCHALLLQALERGADLYLTPRTSSREFLAYARALLRRHASVGAASAGPPLQEEISPPASLPSPGDSCCPRPQGTACNTYRRG